MQDSEGPLNEALALTSKRNTDTYKISASKLHSPGKNIAHLPHLCCNRTYNSIHIGTVLKEAVTIC